MTVIYQLDATLAREYYSEYPGIRSLVYIAIIEAAKSSGQTSHGGGGTELWRGGGVVGTEPQWQQFGRPMNVALVLMDQAADIVHSKFELATPTFLISSKDISVSNKSVERQ